LVVSLTKRSRPNGSHQVRWFFVFILSSLACEPRSLVDEKIPGLLTIPRPTASARISTLSLRERRVAERLFVQLSLALELGKTSGANGGWGQARNGV
jgi:hypothetical protein